MTSTRALFLSAVLGLTTIGCDEDAPPEEIVIGGTISLSGIYVGAVGQHDKFMNEWAEIINERGGIHLKDYDVSVPIRFVFYDDQSVLDNVAPLYSKLIDEEKVDFLIGPYASNMSLRAQEVAIDRQVPLVMCEAGSDSLFFDQDWTVSVIGAATNWPRKYFDMHKALGLAHNVVIIGQNVPKAGELYKGAMDYAAELGFNIVYNQILPDNSVTPVSAETLGGIVDEILALPADETPDIVYVEAVEDVGADFATQAILKGLQPPAYHAPRHGKVAFRDRIEARLQAIDEPYCDRLIDGVSGDVYWAEGITENDSVLLFHEIQERIGYTDQDYPWFGIRMGALDAIKTALENAGSLDRVAVRDALRQFTYTTITGVMGFDPATGEGTMQPVPTQYQDGEIVLIKTDGASLGNYVYPRTYQECSATAP